MFFFYLEILAYQPFLIVFRLLSPEMIISPQADKTIVRESSRQDAVITASVDKP